MLLAVPAAAKYDSYSRCLKQASGRVNEVTQYAKWQEVSSARYPQAATHLSSHRHQAPCPNLAFFGASVTISQRRQAQCQPQTAQQHNKSLVWDKKAYRPFRPTVQALGVKIEMMKNER